jgi:predicted amidohydrolase YtcJ
MRLSIACLLLSAALTASAQPPPQLILYGGKIFTADSDRPWAEAVAIRGKRIVAVGADEEVLALRGAATRLMDLQGRTVIPGINDAHIHVWSAYVWRLAAGRSVETVGMREPPLDEVLARISTELQSAPEGSWINAEVGEKVLSDPRANRTTLDEIAPRHRVQLFGWTGHGLVLNTAAMRALNISDEEPDPIGGWYERIEGTQRVNGVLQGMANWGAKACLAATVPAATVSAQLERFYQDALQFGITSIQDMSFQPPTRVFEALARTRPPIRWREMQVPGATEKCPHPGDERVVVENPLPRVTVSGTKYVLDGTPIERLAWMREPYTDRPDFFGMPYFAADEIARRIASASTSTSDQLLFHVVGDRTTDTVLSLLRSAADSDSRSHDRPRIEHGDFVTSEFWSLARGVGAVVVQNPAHFALPGVMFPRFGPARVSRMMPVRSLLGAGIPLAFGSDGQMNPFLNILFASVHPVNPSEAISREEAVIAYTRGSAFAEFAENEKGTLAPGMLADLAVLSQDIFTVLPGQLPGTRSVMTVIGGRIAYDAGVLN